MNSSIINEGLYIGIVGMTITFVVLALLGFILFLFKVFIYKNGKGTPVEELSTSEEIDYIPEEPKHQVTDKRRIAAIVAAVAEFFSSEKKTEEKYKSTTENKTNKYLKNRRWRNG